MSALTERLGIDDQPWMSDPDRNCSIVGFDDPKWAGFHADRWYPTEAHETPELAKTLCGGCPVIEDCFNFAMLNDVEGVWGATTKSERDEVRKMRKCGTLAGYARHRRHDEDACTDCEAAQAASRREQHAKKKAEYYPTHGTPAGYSWHRRHGIPACEPCLRAQGEKSKAKRAAAKQAAA